MHCTTRGQAKNLMQLKAFAGCPCTVLPHRSLNSSKGIIRDRERCLQSLSEEDLVRELADQGVTHVKHFTVKRESGIVKTNTYLITFSCASLPREIKAGYCIIRVEVFIPTPLVTSASDMVMVYLGAPMAISAIAVEATSTKVLIVRKLLTVITARAPIWLPPRNVLYGSVKRTFVKSKQLKIFLFPRLES